MCAYRSRLRRGGGQIARKAAGELWPGLILDLDNYTSVRAESLPASFHVLDEDTLIRAAQKVGFQIETASTFAQVNFLMIFGWMERRELGL
jgi:hypothetical protein